MRIHGTGPSPCEWFLVSDYPGEREHRQGVSLVGKTGEVVNQFLNGVDLPHRREWYTTCLIKEWRDDGEYTTADVERDAPELLKELRDVHPKVIVTLGRASARWFLGEVDVDDVYGIPWYLPETGTPYRMGAVSQLRRRDMGKTGRGVPQRQVIVPLYNPAAGFRSPEVQSKVWDGFRQLAFYLDDQLEPRELFKDAYPSPVYRRLTSTLEVSEVLHKCREVAIDSEGLPGRVWSVQFTMQPGTAFLIRESDTEALAAFFWGLQRWAPVTTYHGSLHDFAIMRELMTKLGIPLDILYDLRFDDTQIMSYVLQLNPLGLKANGVRHCNMNMREYTDVIGDAQHKLALDYLVRLFDTEFDDWKNRCQAAFDEARATPLLDKRGKPRRNKKTGEIQYRRVTKIPQLPMSSLHKAVKRVLRSDNPFKLWQDQSEDIRVAAYNREIPE